MIIENYFVCERTGAFLSQDSNQGKRLLRSSILSRRMVGTYSPDCHMAVCAHVISWLSSLASKPDKIFLYSPFRNEPDLEGIRDHMDSSVAFGLPVMKPAHSMDFYRWESKKSLIKNSYGIAEPDPQVSESLRADHQTLVLCPALGVDRSGVRLGYGGGYYDRYFGDLLRSNRQHQPVLMGVVWDEFFFDKPLPFETTDIRMAWIATEKGIFKAQTETGKERM